MPVEDTFRLITTTLSRLGVFVAHGFLFGLIPVLVLVVRPSFRELPPTEWALVRQRTASRLQDILSAALIASFICTVIMLVVQATLTAEMMGGRMSMDSVSGVAQTSFGRWHLARFPMLLAMAVLLSGRVRVWALAERSDDQGAASPLWWSVWGVLAVGLLLTSTMSGHTLVATPRSLAIPNDLVHLCAGATWFAGIVYLASVLPQTLRSKKETEKLRLIAPAVTRFSRLALVAITLVTATGIVNSLLHVERLSDLWMTGYGRSLGAKLSFFVGVILLGAVNHFFVRKRMERAVSNPALGSARPLFRRTIAIELALAFAIFGSTALLTNSARTKDSPTIGRSTNP